MRLRAEIIGNSRLRKLPSSIVAEAAELNLREGRFLVVFSADEDGWEHVSVSPWGSKYEKDQPCPSWEQMCAVKRYFWPDDEMALQLHPPEGRYLHGIGGSTNILHLWRPCGGDWARLGEKE